MTYPTAPTDPLVVIAADANYNAPGEDWDGTPTKTTPSAGVQLQGYVPGDPRPADFDNYLFNNFAQWATFFKNALAALFDGTNFTYPTTHSRTVWFSLTGAGGQDSVSPGWASSYSSNTRYWTTTNNPNPQQQLSKEVEIPSGSVITGFSVRWQPGSARAGANRMQAALYDGGGTLIGSFYDSGGAALVTDSVGSLSHTVDRTVAGAGYQLKITSGNSTHTDSAYGFAITFTDPGPRNF